MTGRRAIPCNHACSYTDEWKTFNVRFSDEGGGPELASYTWSGLIASFSSLYSDHRLREQLEQKSYSYTYTNTICTLADSAIASYIATYRSLYTVIS